MLRALAPENPSRRRLSTAASISAWRVAADRASPPACLPADRPAFAIAHPLGLSGCSNHTLKPGDLTGIDPARTNDDDVYALVMRVAAEPIDVDDLREELRRIFAG